MAWTPKYPCGILAFSVVRRWWGCEGNDLVMRLASLGKKPQCLASPFCEVGVLRRAPAMISEAITWCQSGQSLDPGLPTSRNNSLLLPHHQGSQFVTPVWEGWMRRCLERAISFSQWKLSPFLPKVCMVTVKKKHSTNGQWIVQSLITSLTTWLHACTWLRGNLRGLTVPTDSYMLLLVTSHTGVRHWRLDLPVVRWTNTAMNTPVSACLPFLIVLSVRASVSLWSSFLIPV